MPKPSEDPPCPLELETILKHLARWRSLPEVIAMVTFVRKASPLENRVFKGFLTTAPANIDAVTSGQSDKSMSASVIASSLE
jgi:hypothetical protein